MPVTRPIDLHRRLPGYAPTSLVRLEGAIEGIAAPIVVKLETSRYGLPSFKVLGASWAVGCRIAGWLGPHAPDDRSYDAIRPALDAHGTRPTLVAATDGNHGRAVAWSARQLGCAAEVFVPAGTAQSRRQAIVAEGAALTVVEGDYDETVAAAAARATGDRLLVQDTALEGGETGVEDVVAGYATVFDELAEQLSGGSTGPCILVVPVGVGSLALAAARFIRERRAGDHLVTVEPTEAASLQRSLVEGRLVAIPGPHVSCMVGLRCGSISAGAWPELRAATDLAMAIEDADADEAMRWLAQRGVVVGECGAATLAAARRAVPEGLLQPLLANGDATLVLIATEAPTDPERWRAVVGRDP
ncbi:MAG: pyridoxal-phosphate dependent enzyme [Chloroflexi bacterium]|nr:pyridoxal-phosphate dependent enzyme [Chloroflexota bacterium]